MHTNLAIVRVSKELGVLKKYIIIPHVLYMSFEQDLY